METGICGVLCFQELNNSNVCVAKSARHCPIRKSDWGYKEANGSLQHAGQPRWPLISGSCSVEENENCGELYIYIGNLKLFGVEDE